MKEGWIIVTQMQTVQTHLEVITAFATLDLLEMDIPALVGSKLVYSIKFLDIYKFGNLVTYVCAYVLFF